MYGVMFALGVLVAYYVAKYLARKKGIDEKIISDIAIYIILSGIIGARLLYVILNLDYFLRNPFDILKIWEGGLAYFGGLIAAIITGYIYVKRKDLDFFLFADLIAIPLVIGHIFGRIGDYLTGGHPGTVTNLPWAILLEGALRHPVVIYEILGLFAILGILFLIKNRIGKGELFLSYLMLYSVQRFALDFFREEMALFGLKSAQYITLILFIVAMMTLIIRRVKKVNE
ncbi:MAG: prolipoprotein diacylglyceryl transferase [Candidatus Aenigmarchaeota archaeon]|nr:prolipoprotein diacylglyceryl transferase [Candidatus Aenigmarchaeota archaeon]